MDPIRDDHDLPDAIRQLIEDMMKKFGTLSSEEILSIFSVFVDQAHLDELEDILKQGGSFSFVLDPNDIENLNSVMSDFQDEENLFDRFDSQPDEIYYEISAPIDGKGEIIVELPFVSNIDQIEWYEFENEIYLYTVNSMEEIKLLIELEDQIDVLEDETRFVNGLFIIPYLIL